MVHKLQWFVIVCCSFSELGIMVVIIVFVVVYYCGGLSTIIHNYSAIVCQFV